jgi:DNA-binding beta-propeller fold protein YncE
MAHGTTTFRGPAAILAGALLVKAALAAAAPAYVLDRRIGLSGDEGWDYSIVDAQSHRLFQSRGRRVDVLDTGSCKVVGSIADTYGVHGIALAPDLGKGYTSNGLSGTVREFDLATLKPGPLIKAGENPDCILYDPFTHRVFAFNGKSRDATVIDALADTVVATIPLDCKPEFAVTDGQGAIYVNREDKDSVAVIDAHKLVVSAIWPLGAKSPSGLALDPARHHLFSVCSDNRMAVLDTRSGKVLDYAPIGAHPDAAAFDPGTGLAFSSNGEGSLTVVDAAADTGFPVLDSVATQKGARTMALDPGTHTLYMVSAQFLSPTAADAEHPHPRPRIKPGSVQLLVLVKK